MTLFQKVFSFLLLALLLSSCYKDQVINTETIDVVGAEKIYLNTINGQVLDTLGEPIPSVLIEIGDRSEMTDEDGSFSIVDVMIPNTGSFVSATHDHYFEGGTRVYATAPITQTIQINLVPKGTSTNFSNSQGATVDVGILGKVIIPSDAFIKDNTTYQGMVTLEVYMVNPNDPESFNKRIQVFEVYEPLSEEKILNSNLTSIMYIEAYDADGNTLEISSEKNLQVNMPTYDNMDAEFPRLFSFNEEIGFWEYEKNVILESNQFIVDLDHFSWWGVGTARLASEVCITLVNEGNMGDHFYTVSTATGKRIKAGGVIYGEEFCFQAPTEEILEIRVHNSCFVEFFSASHFTGNSENSQVEIEVENNNSSGFLIEIEVVDCDFTPLQDTVDVIFTTDRSFEHIGRGVGTFDFELEECFDQREGAIIVDHNLGNTRYTYAEQVNIRPDIKQYNIQVVACQDVMPEEGHLTINGITYFGTIARKNPQETLIIAGENDDEVVIGFDGFEEGTFPGRIVSFGLNAFCEGKVTVDFYGEVGDYIHGSFEIPENEALHCEAITGDFIAFRER